MKIHVRPSNLVRSSDQNESGKALGIDLFDRHCSLRNPRTFPPSGSQVPRLFGRFRRMTTLEMVFVFIQRYAEKNPLNISCCLYFYTGKYISHSNSTIAPCGATCLGTVIARPKLVSAQERASRAALRRPCSGRVFGVCIIQIDLRITVFDCFPNSHRTYESENVNHKRLPHCVADERPRSSVMT